MYNQKKILELFPQRYVKQVVLLDSNGMDTSCLNHEGLC